MHKDYGLAYSCVRGDVNADRCHLANSFETSSYELDMLVDLLDEKEDDDNYLKNRIASHRNTSAETLDKLLKINTTD